MKFAIAIMSLIVTMIFSEMLLQYPQDGLYGSRIIDVDGDGNSDWVVEIDLWNVEKANGILNILSGKDYLLRVSVNLDSVVLKDPSKYVHGYPEIWCGAKPWNDFGPVACGNLMLPEPINSASDIDISVDYAILRKSFFLPYNFSFDMWLVRSMERPHSVKADEVEIMIWLDYANLKPAGKVVKRVKIPVFINGTKKLVIFSLYRSYMPWEYLAFLIEKPLRKGKISFNLKSFVELAVKVSRIRNWKELFLSDVELGTEFGSPRYLKGIRFEWIVRNFEVKREIEHYAR